MAHSGKLMIIGGGEDKKNDKIILKEFVRLAGGDLAKIVIMTCATNLPVEVAKEYSEVLREIGGPAIKISTLDIRERAEANAPAAVESLLDATAVFFTGGSQLQLVRSIGGTKIDTILHNRYENGLVIAGTSAGASMMSSIMIVEGPAGETATVGLTTLGGGLEFLRGVIVDQHFAQRGRTHRLISAIARYPHFLGIGIDEDTALIVSGTLCHVIGQGSITILDAGGVAEGIPDRSIDESENISISGIKLHLLSSGSRFDLRNRIHVENV
jgi:cyanophycinase